MLSLSHHKIDSIIKKELSEAAKDNLIYSMISKSALIWCRFRDGVKCLPHTVLKRVKQRNTFFSLSDYSESDNDSL